jgi:hypothetical protein
LDDFYSGCVDVQFEKIIFSSEKNAKKFDYKMWIVHGPKVMDWITIQLKNGQILRAIYDDNQHPSYSFET